MKKIIWVFGCLLALTACSGAQEAPQNETVTFSITDSTVMEVESISEGDMITVEMNEDGTAASVKAADMPVQTENEAVTKQ